ncbi:MAG: 23S rRNA (guanosine(2251)-2'-O)-methyltransferase RlmB [Alphaproteobacteria bacterium]
MRPGHRAGQWIYGAHAVLAALANPRRRWHRLLLTATAEKTLGERVRNVIAARGHAIDDGSTEDPGPEIITAKALDGLLAAGAVHQGIALEADDLPQTGIEDIVALARGNSAATVVVLDQVTDPRNVGAVMRSTAAFGGLAVIQTARGGADVTAALAKAASGALDMVPLVRVTNLAQALDSLKGAGFWCIGLDAGAPETLAKTDLSGKVALVLGAEGKGLRRLSRERCDVLAQIPVAPRLASLNVSTAAAISLYETVRQRQGQ